MATADTELLLFVREALSAGRSREDIAVALRGADCPDDQVQAALSRFAEVSFPVPVPRPRVYLSPRVPSSILSCSRCWV